MNLEKHLNLAGNNLLNCLCPERNFLPYWHIVVSEDCSAEYQFRPHCNGHNVGRWWNAMLRLQSETGFTIHSSIETAMLENTWQMCENPAGILLDAPIPGDPGTWYIHSYRETMLALGLLVRYRGNELARKFGLRAIERMRNASKNLSQWDFSTYTCSMNIGSSQGTCYTHGRAIEGLLCFYQATGEQIAFEEAERLAEFHFQHSVISSGELSSGCGFHTHSYLNTLRGLLMIAAMKGQSARLESLYATFCCAVSTMITPSGFISHDIGDVIVRFGDIASAGDIAHIALLLWDHFKDSALLDEAERIVRCRVIPAQVCEPMPIRPKCNKPSDSFRDLPQRFVGAIGGSVGQVRGQTCTTDFTASALHSLIELYRRAVDVNRDFVRVNFHFDRELKDIRVHCTQERFERRIAVCNNTGKSLLIRVPGWAPVDSLRLVVNNQQIQPVIHDGFACIPSQGEQGRHIFLSFALPATCSSEQWCELSATQKNLIFHWLGDEIEFVEPVGRYLDPFPKECIAL